MYSFRDMEECLHYYIKTLCSFFVNSPLNTEACSNVNCTKFTLKY